jgi:uncharacterized repeat protein (TIGR03803 family)
MSGFDKGRALWRACTVTLALAAGAADAGAVTAAGYAVMHTFQKTDGFGVHGELVQTADGTLFGTGYFGGDGEAGTVFSIKPTGKFPFAMLHAFSIADGAASATGLTLGTDGNLYGLTGGGGDYGGGTAFRMSPAGAFTTLHSFGGPAGDGAYPYLGALVQAADGNFYGANQQGGSGGQGTLFRMTPAGQVTVLHAFAGGGTDGALPRGGLMRASDGFLYGTTVCGGVTTAAKGCGGTVYRLNPKNGGFTLIHKFNPADAPQATLTEAGGFLYGTTSAGGAGKFGTVFRIALVGHAFTTLHAFGGGVRAKPANDDGAVPTGRLLVASDGNLYGTTSLGGANAAIDPNGDGTIFRVTPAGGYAVVHTFGASVDDSARPYAGLVQGLDGNLYGAARNGAYQSEGTLFKLALPAQ